MAAVRAEEGNSSTYYSSMVSLGIHNKSGLLGGSVVPRAYDPKDTSVSAAPHGSQGHHSGLAAIMRLHHGGAVQKPVKIAHRKSCQQLTC